MGQEVKNPLRAQSKYGLMGSSAKTGKKIFRGSPEHFLDKNAIWDRTPATYTSIAVYMCGEGSRSQIFKQNSIISICSKVMAFLVISLSLWSPHCPHVVPIIPTSSLCHPCHPHIVPIAPRRSLMWSPWLWSLLSLLSPSHVVPMVPLTSSRRFPHHP